MCPDIDVFQRYFTAWNKNQWLWAWNLIIFSCGMVFQKTSGIYLMSKCTSYWKILFSSDFRRKWGIYMPTGVFYSDYFWLILGLDSMRTHHYITVTQLISSYLTKLIGLYCDAEKLTRSSYAWRIIPHYETFPNWIEAS